MKPDTLAVIGLGAIGGSVAWQARLAGVTAVRGYSPEPAESVLALRAGALTDIADTPARAAEGAGLVVLAAPPAATLHLLGSIGPSLAPGAVVTDVTSVKSAVIARAMAVGLGARFAGSHPFTGTHGSGWAHARADRFRGVVAYVTPTPDPGGADVAREVMGFWKDVMEAHPVLIDAAAHDRQLAWTSHLPQAVASALAAALARRHLGGVSYGGGARDTTRLAASSAELWTDLFLLNQAEVVQAVRGAEAELAGLRELIEAGDRAALQAFLERAAVFRRGIDR